MCNMCTLSTSQSKKIKINHNFWGGHPTTQDQGFILAFTLGGFKWIMYGMFTLIELKLGIFKIGGLLFVSDVSMCITLHCPVLRILYHHPCVQPVVKCNC